MTELEPPQVTGNRSLSAVAASRTAQLSISPHQDHYEFPRDPHGGRAVIACTPRSLHRRRLQFRPTDRFGVATIRGQCHGPLLNASWSQWRKGKGTLSRGPEGLGPRDGLPR